VYDASVDIAATNRVALGLYYAYASGGAASAFNYAVHNSATLGYLELSIRF
jgi:hypothetical protein